MTGPTIPQDISGSSRGETFKVDADVEERRRHALRSYDISGTGTDPLFDIFTEWLAKYLSVPIVLISFVDDDQLLIRSKIGFAADKLPRSESFCRYAIESDDVLVVADAVCDPRFNENPWVRGEPYLRFYAGAPIITPDGYRIGVICMADSKLRPDLGDIQVGCLLNLAQAVMRELESRKTVSNLVFHQELNTEIALARDFQTALLTALERAGKRLDALYCLVPQLLEDERYFRFAAGVAIDPQYQDLVNRVLASEAMEIAKFRDAPVLTERKALDTGVITETMQDKFTDIGREFFTLGSRRQLAVPLTLGTRNAAVLVGFKRQDISIAERGFLANLVDKLVPLLLGRLREEELSRRSLHMAYVNRAMRTLIGANQALAKATAELEFMQAICEVAVVQGGYSAAWVGLADHDEARSIRVVAKWGRDLESLGTLPLTWADTAFGRGASGTAMRENRVVAIHNIARDPRVEPFRYSKLATQTFGSCIAVPLRQTDGCAFGVFTLYNNARDEIGNPDQLSFDREEEQLLTELARDIVNGINMIRDRDARNEALRKQHESDAKLDNLLASNPTILFALEYDGRVWRNVEMTRNFERVIGHPPEAVKTDGWWERHLHPEDLASALDALRRIKTTRHETYQFRLIQKNGCYRWIRTEMQLQPAIHGEPPRIIGAWSDITEKQTAQEEIHRLAFYDQLTGLPNRQLLKDKILKTVGDPKRRHLFSALLFVDLDRFKAINDAHGHEVGDHVLITVAKRLSRGLRKNDVVARLGGDEFVVLLPELGENAAAAASLAGGIAKKLANSLDRQMSLNRLTLRVTASIGVHAFAGLSTMEEILRSADIAMYAAKAATKSRAWSYGQSNISVFETGMQEIVTKFHVTQNEVKSALAEQRLELWLQPQVDAVGAIAGAEALIRLRRADGSYMQPDTFITIAEETGLIVPVGKWVRAEACRLLASFSTERLPRLSVNVSAMEFRQPRMAEEFLALLKQTRTEPKRLALEITENLLLDPLDDTLARLEKLQEAGITLSIDDFGTGYSSLGYLQRMPVKEIKIDKRFVHDMLGDQRSAELTQTLIMLAKNFGFNVVAEGVETRRQAAFLRRHGCAFLQGHLFGKPRPAAEFNLTPVKPLMREAAVGV